MKIGIIGLGKMGGRIAQKLSIEGHDVIAWNRSPQEVENVKVTDSIENLIQELNPPRVVWIMVSANAVDAVLSEIRKFISPGDILIDGGNSFYKDTERRFAEFEKMGIRFLGIGVSGGLPAFKNGYPMMVGGSRSGYDEILPVLDSLASPNGGHEYFGTGGAGHFVKMVHNGIEYGIMQSLGEGFEILEKASYRFNLVSIAKLWQKGTIISGFLIDRGAEMLDKEPELSSFVGAVARSGEGDWTLEAAQEEKVNASAIEVAVEYRKKSETDGEIQKSFTARVINALRQAFGGHEVKKKGY